jgi:hypothetical protein
MRSAAATLRWRSTSGREGLGAKAARRRVAGSLLILSPLLFGVPVAIGIVISVVRLIGTRYPILEWATTVNSDAEELYLGHTLYQNPAHGYTGLIYTPLFPALTSVIYHVYLWNGWPLLLVIGASVSLAILAARIAYLPAGPTARVARMLGAAGIGGVAYWCVSSIHLSLLDEARADQVAWAFALFGLIAVADFGPLPSRRRVVLAALLLSAALWTKQTTIGVAVVALAWVFALAAASALSRKAAWLFTVVFGGVNLALLLVLNLLTEGWELYINFEMATRQATESRYASYVIAGLRSSALAIGFVGLMWLAATMSWRRSSGHARAPTSTEPVSGGSRLRSLLAAEDPTGRRALLLGLYAGVGFVLAVYYLRKQGTETNQYIGVVWALGLLAAAGWRVAQRHAGTAAAAGGCVALLFALVQLGPIRAVAADATVAIPDLENAVQWHQIPAELRAWVRHHTLYSSLYADLNVPQGGPLYPNYYNFADKLAAGIQPMFLVRALLDRRFDGVTFFELDREPYSSGYGKWEENYLWKLDEVIAARYAPEPGLPFGILGRRPGPVQATWMNYCFGPFVAGGASFRIHHGGGFWCSFEPDRLRLVRAPTPLSEVVTEQPARLAGKIAVSLEGGAPAQVNLVLGGGQNTWKARVAVPPGDSRDLTVSTYLNGAPLGSTLVPAAAPRGGRREVQLSMTPTPARPGPPISVGPGAATLTTPATRALFALIATDGATIDLNAAHLGH